MKILIDMNLSPQWVSVFGEEGIKAIHWSAIGRPDASDRQIMHYAHKKDYVVFTHDLDFGTLLAASNAKGPSVIQIRTEDTTPQALKDVIVRALEQFSSHLEEGALVTIDLSKMRARILPLTT